MLLALFNLVNEAFYSSSCFWGMMMNNKNEIKI